MTIAEKKLSPTMSDAMSSATHYHDYIWEKVNQHLGERILEIGVGTGQYTRRMLAEGKSVMGADISIAALDLLRKSVSSPLFQTLHMDLTDPVCQKEELAHFYPDTILLVNVLEHISNPMAALSFLRNVSSRNTKLVIFVPALSWLFNRLDSEAGHFRRFNRRTLGREMRNAGWWVRLLRYVNFPGVPGWFIAGLLGRASGSQGSLNADSTNFLIKMYDRFFAKLPSFTDPFLGLFMGLSLLGVGEKEEK